MTGESENVTAAGRAVGHRLFPAGNPWSKSVFCGLAPHRKDEHIRLGWHPLIHPSR
ncbi:hypothetical protein CHELA40_10125 [Chelatococcus asaccharovorans]|nr:hypothetical protein CHELA40_10125 [Chelatococcus asaccharovorans]CAH1687340.1 hypothetical protein CHELA17_65481 [Chelatococcus asaccharovorans]